MFYQDNNKGSHNGSTTPQRDISLPEALGIASLLGVAVASQKMNAINAFYFRNYEKIYFGAWVLCLLLLALGIRKLVKATRPFEEHVGRLRHVWSANGVFAGNMDDGTPIYVSDKSRCGHVQIIGTTGRGKTESVILPWLVRDLERGSSALLIDGKGDTELARKIREEVEGRSLGSFVTVFDLGNPKISCTTNPLHGGSPQQIVDRLFAAFEFDDSYYRGVQYEVANAVVSLIHEQRHGTVTFRDIWKCLTQDAELSELVAASENEALQARLTRYLQQPFKDREANMMGLTSQLGPFAVGEIANLVNGERRGREFRALSQVLLERNGPEVLVFLIPTLKYQKLGKQLGKLLLQELAWAVGERASRSGAHAPFVPVFLDEFSAFVYEGFESILNKARSSQVALHLSHQSVGDFELVGPEFAKVVNTNTNVKCLMGLNDPDTADFFARHMGTETQEKLTERAQTVNIFGHKERTGQMSIREVEAYRIHPNALKNFTNGRGVIHLPTPKGTISEVIQYARL